MNPVRNFNNKFLIGYKDKIKLLISNGVKIDIKNKGFTQLHFRKDGAFGVGLLGPIFSQKSGAGFSVVELIIALAIFAILATGVFYVATNSYKNFYGVGDTQTVTEFADEGIEIVRAIRNNSWQTIETVSGGGAKGIAKNADGYWEFSGTENTSGDLTRTVTITNAQRDANWDITDSGTEDPNTKKVVVTVSGTGIDNYVLTTYMTNWAYKTWEQSDWSGVGDREFWSDLTMASSSYSNINTTTVGELVLSQTASPGAVYGDLTSFATTSEYDLTAYRAFYDYEVSPDGDTLYGTGHINVDVKAWDITNIREGIFDTLLWENSMSNSQYKLIVHPNGDYLYVLDGDLDNAETSTVYWISVVDTTDGSVTSGVLCDDYMSGDDLKGMDMTLSSDNSMLYAISSYGGFYAYEVSADGATLTPKRDGGGGEDSKIVSVWQEWGYTPQEMYLDDSGGTDYMYVVSDYGSHAMTKWDISSSTEPSLEYAYAGSGDCNSLEFLGDNGSGNEFAIACDDSTTELKTILDTGSALSVLDTADPGTFNTTAELEYDGDDTVVMVNKTSGDLAAWDVADTSDITELISADTTTIELMYTTWPQGYLEYNDKKGGYFIQDYGQAAVEDGIGFIPRPETRNIGTGYDYKRTITIDSGSTKVVSGPHAYFPVLFSEIQTYLKTETNGGKVKHDKGYDIIFTSDSAGSTILDYEIEKYSSTTGELIAWVEVDSLTTNKDIFMFYGNSNINTSQERMNGVWDSNGFKYVNHLYQRHDLVDEQPDSAAFNNYLPNYNEAAQSDDGKIGYAHTYDGNGDYGYVTHSDDFGFVDEFTHSAWVRIDGVSASTLNGLVAITGSRYYANEVDPAYIQIQVWDDTDTKYNLGTQASFFNFGEWTKVDIVFDRPTTKLYRNGTWVRDYTTDYDLKNTTGQIITGTIQTNLYWMNGKLDEVRIGNTAKSAGWVKTAYNNESSTSTFYIIGSEEDAGGYNTPGSLYSSILDLGSTDKELKSLTVEQNIPSGCDLQITAEVSDDITFATGVTSEVYSDASAGYYTSSTDATMNGKRYLRYKADMTACNSNTETPTLYGARFNYR